MPAPSLVIDTTTRDAALIVSLSGSLGALSCHELEQRLNSAVVGDPTRLVFDLSGIDFIGSAGLRIFLNVEKRIKKIGGRVHFCGLTENVRNVFDISGLAAYTNIYASLDEALRAFGPS